jgi:hypothetical protein
MSEDIHAAALAQYDLRAVVSTVVQDDDVGAGLRH